eukprot:4616214-Amphidinium_carterae.1
MIALVNQGDPRWHTPSTVISKSRCKFCETEDEIDRPLHICWIGAREDRYFCQVFWDPVEALYRAIRTEEAEDQMLGAGWRMRQASQGFKNYRASTLNASVVLYREESKVWATAHHIEEAEEFSRIDSAQCELYLMAT